MMHCTQHMDRTIFYVKTSVFATSLYLLICSLLDAGMPPTLARIRASWNGTERDLDEAARELLQWGILEPTDMAEENKRLWVAPSTRWHRPVQPPEVPTVQDEVALPPIESPRTTRRDRPVQRRAYSMPAAA